MSELCNADLEREIKITLWEYHEDGHHEEKGCARIVAKEFIQRETGKGEMSLDIHDKKNNQTVVGQFVLGEPTVETRPGFVKVNSCFDVHLFDGCVFTPFVSSNIYLFLKLFSISFIVSFFLFTVFNFLLLVYRRRL
jgi:hypothetical protein